MNELILWLATMVRERQRWRESFVREPGKARVFYGYEFIPTSREVTSGGMVKSQDLQTVFPNTPQKPNLLYLISSALPPYAPRMAGMAKRAGAKVVLNQNGVAYPGWHGKGWERTNLFLREVLQQADYVFYQSNFCKLGADRYLGECSRNFEILHNPVDTTFFKPSPTARLQHNPVRLLLAGTHTHFYRVQTAVDTIKHLREAGQIATLEIAGRYGWEANPNDAETQLCSYIQRQELTDVVSNSGPYTQEQARLIFQRADILLHTQYNDSCPRLVLEAMACGLPVVYSSSGGTPELVGDTAGRGVPAPLDWQDIHPPDPKEMAAAILEISKDYESYSRKARERAVSLFDVRPWIERHRLVFESLCKAVSPCREFDKQ